MTTDKIDVAASNCAVCGAHYIWRDFQPCRKDPPPKEPDDELARAMVKLDESACGSSKSAQLIALRNVLRILARKAGAP